MEQKSFRVSCFYWSPQDQPPGAEIYRNISVSAYDSDEAWRKADQVYRDANGQPVSSISERRRYQIEPVEA